MNAGNPVHTQPPKRKPGRPPTYIFSKPDSELSENERRLKGAVIKRRLRQNRSYHRKKCLRQLQSSISINYQVPHPTLPPPPITSPPPILYQTTPPPPSHPSTSFPLTSIPPLFPDSSSLPNRHPPLGTRLEPQTQQPPPPPPPPQQPITQNNNNSSPYYAPQRPNPLVPSPQEPDANPPQVPSPLTRHLPLPISSQPGLHNSQPPHPASPFASNEQRFPVPQAPPTITHVDAPRPPRDPAPVIDDIFHATSSSSSAPTIPGSHQTIRSPTDVPPPLRSPTLVREDFEQRLSALPNRKMTELRHLTLFPASFTAAAAIATAIPVHHDYRDVFADFIQPLLNDRILLRLPHGRFNLNDLVRRLLVPHRGAEARVGMQRFVNHFIWELGHSNVNSISNSADERLKVMRLYDSERPNFQVAFEICRDTLRGVYLTSFMTRAATVMRYSMAPAERVRVMESTVAIIEAERASSMEHLEAEVRMRLALGEAYFDSLSFANAEPHLRIAIDKMATAKSGDGITVSSSVLALLLLAELRIDQRELNEANKLLRQVLRTLREADLQRSTFAVCAMLNLGSVYSWMNDPWKAMQVVEAAMEVLVELGFNHSPLYADALRALGAVHLRAGDAKKAQDAFFSALRIVENWLDMKGWEVIPYQHCLHLDVFLLELIAQTYVAQNRNDDASKLVDEAREKRRERGLEGQSICGIAGSSSDGSQGSPMFFTRHLY